ncbi:diguanylate cyclase [Roseateles sp. P5_D6]
MNMGSLKLRLALASALLIALSVAITVILSVREVQQRTEDTILASNLGVAQLAATLSANVIEHQRALVAAAQSWPKGQAADPARVRDFLAQQTVLRTLFNHVIIAPADSLPVDRYGQPHLVQTAAAAGAPDLPHILLSRPLPAADGKTSLLAGVLQLGAPNFLTSIAQVAQLDDLRIRTIVADQQGRVLAHADDGRLMTQVDDDADLSPAVTRWRQQGSPLEATPWTGRYGEQFIAMAAVPGTDWMLFRLSKAEALFGVASRSITRTIALGVVVGLVGALAIFGFTAWLLRPLGALRQRALLALDPAQAPEKGWPDAGGEVGELASVLKHVSEQLAASHADIEQSLQRMQAVMAHAPVGIAFINEGRIELASNHLESMLGYEPGELICHWEALVAPEVSSEALRAATTSAYESGQNFETELPLRRRDGSTLWARLYGAAVQGTRGRRIWIATDATEVRRQREDLQWTASHDPLTELVNRREFERRLGQLVADRRRHEAACALFIDLDHFKQVNDLKGHAAGDDILKKMAQVLRTCVRSGDTVCRLGGDEFAVLLPACNLDRGLLIAEQMRSGIASEGVSDGDTAPGVTASIGVVEIDTRPQSLAEVLEAADKACYAAKHAGRNAVRCAAVRP